MAEREPNEAKAVDVEALLRGVVGPLGGTVIDESTSGARSPPQKGIDLGNTDNRGRRDSDYSVDSWEVREWLEGLMETDPNAPVLQRLREVPVPEGIDAIASWSRLTDSASDDGRDDMTKAKWPQVPKPTIVLDDQGLPQHHTCPHCQHVVVHADLLPETQKVSLCRNRRELADASLDGCCLLQWFEWYLYEHLSDGPSETSDVSLIVQGRTKGRFIDSIKGEFLDRAADGNTIVRKGSFGPFSFVAKQGTLAEGYIDYSPVNLDVGSGDAMLEAYYWWDACRRDHKACRVKVKIKPKRLLKHSFSHAWLVDYTKCFDKDEDSPDDMYTKQEESSESETDEADYVALSYCWGGDQTAKTTKANLRDRETTGIDVASLPQTIQDAIYVAENCCIDYIWIDSLCIVQDDAVEKDEEILKMGHIYSGAAFTISAAAATSCEDGFLRRREPSEMRQNTLALRMVSERREREWYFYLYSRETHSPMKEAINNRAWTLQESLLSPRLLIFGTWQMRWTCWTKNFTHGGPPGVYHQPLEHLAARLNSKETIPILKQRMETAKILELRHQQSMLNMRIDDMHDLWKQIVKEYGSRCLSVATDRPLAILGVAQKYSELIGDSYCHGFFQETLPGALTWRRPHGYRPSAWSPTTQSSSGGPKRRQPTWSWTSVDGPIEFPTRSDLRRSNNSAQVKSATNETGGGSNIGDDGPLITIEGVVRKVFVMKDLPSPVFFDFRDPGLANLTESERARLEDDLAVTINPVWDDDGPLSSPDDVVYNGHTFRVLYALELIPYHTGSQGARSPAGILLESTAAGSTEFRRLGYFDSEWDNNLWLKLYQMEGGVEFEERRKWMRRIVFSDRNMLLVSIV